METDQTSDVAAEDGAPSNPAEPSAGAPMIYQAIANVMAEMEGVGRGDQAPAAAGGYQYRGIESVTRALQKLCGKHGIVIYPVTKIQGADKPANMNEGWLEWRLEVTWQVAGLDGIPLDPAPVTYGLGRDNSDKGVNKSMTQAFKYLLLQLFMISDGKDDPDAHSYEEGRVDAGRETEPVAEYVDRETATDLASQIGQLDQTQRQSLADSWAAEDPMTGEPFLPLDDNGKPSIRFLTPAMIPAVRAMIANVRKGRTAIEGDDAREAPEGPQDAPVDDPATSPAADPPAATEAAPVDDAGARLEEAKALQEQAKAEARQALAGLPSADPAPTGDEPF